MHPTVTAPASQRTNTVVLTLLCLAQFMLILDISAVNVALPTMGRDLHLSRDSLTWVVTAYTVAFGSLMVLGGRLADAVGARRTLMTGLVIFVLASAFTGVAGTPAILIGGRIAQGIGAALISPAALSILAITFHDDARTRALAIWSALAGAGVAVGVLLGGALVTGPGWRWIFYINVPVGVLLLVTLPRLVAVRRGHPVRVDAAGAVLVAGASATLIYGVVNAGDVGWSAPAVIVALAVSAALYAIFAIVERASTQPLLNLRVLARRRVIGGSYLMLVSTGLLVGFFFLGSIYLQHGHGYSALHTGLLFLPVAVATGGGAHVGSRRVVTAGPRPVAVVGLLLVGAAFTLTAAVATPTALVVGMVVAAAGIGAVFVAATATALADAGDGESGLASALVNTFHEFGASVGIAVVSTIAAAGADHAVSGFTHAFTFCAVAAAGAAALSGYVVPAGRAHGVGPMRLH